MARLTQKQVAEKLGQVSSAQIFRWERGERLPKLEHALQLSALYKRMVNDLFFDLYDEKRDELAQEAQYQTQKRASASKR